jgi:uncharacterized protein (DUF2147 family)
MKKISTVYVSFVCASLLMLGIAHAEDLDVAGLWLTDTGDAHIKITDCDDATPCGVIAWLDPETQEADSDLNNPDPALRSRPLLGLPFIWGFERKGERWRSGKIYDPKDGKTYRSSLELRDDGTLHVKGCVGPFCRKLIWTRVQSMGEAAD